ncbi:MAG: hypothetical protein ABIF82_00740 [Planctomycetota bacterium]
MFGKFFSSTFTGSMFGAGTDVFAVWGYVVANVIDSSVELNPPLLAAILGTDADAIERAIAILTAPDPKSRNPAEDGRRLIHEGGYQYRVTSHEIYRSIRNEEERRAYNREAQSRSRAKRSKLSNGVSLTQPQKSTTSAHTEAESRKQKTERNVRTGFDAFWDQYPKKVAKATALRAWTKLAPAPALIETIVSALAYWSGSEDWQKDDGRFIPYPATWLNARRWEDERPAAAAAAQTRGVPDCDATMAYLRSLKGEKGRL